jgi:hypothetical protein
MSEIDKNHLNPFEKTEVRNPDALHGPGPRELQPWVITKGHSSDFRGVSGSEVIENPKDVSALEVAVSDGKPETNLEKVDPVSLSEKQSPAQTPTPSASETTSPVLADEEPLPVVKAPAPAMPMVPQAPATPSPNV